jgi:hypothetical protein
MGAYAIGGAVSALLSSRASVPVASQDYMGPYSIEPDADGEILQTKDYYMKENVTVEPIPVRNTTNPSGGYTISIAEPKIGG